MPCLGRCRSRFAPSPLGLDLEAKAVKDEALASARAYVEFRKNPQPAERLRIWSDCASKIDNPYCEIEGARTAMHASKQAQADVRRAKRSRKAVSKTQARSAVLAALASGNYGALRDYPEEKITAAIDDYASYEKMRPAIASARASQSGA